MKVLQTQQNRLTTVRIARTIPVPALRSVVSVASTTAPRKAGFCMPGGFDMGYKSVEERFWSKVDTSGECWVWTGAKTFDGGYGQIGTGVGKKLALAHRFSYELAYGPITNGLWVLHRCDNPSCVRPDHLFLGTGKDNAQDMVAKGRGWQQRHPEEIKRGENHGNAKFTDEQVLSVRAAFASGLGVKELARQYKTYPSTIRRMLNGKGWAHLPNIAAERYRTMDRPRMKKLTAEIAREIRALADAGMKQRIIAERFGLDTRTVNGIVRRENWKDA